MEVSGRNVNYSLNPPPPLEDFPVLQTEKYTLRLASTEEELESIFRLRFEVFNLELGLGFSTSNFTQMDIDKFDAVCHHLILISKQTGKAIGTYRMQTYMMASQRLGFDAADIFNLNAIPNSVLQASVEVGRTCIAKEYRNSQALLLLWKGLADYLIWSRNQYFFGCASLLTQCSWQATCVYDYFQQNGLMHPSILVYPNSQSRLEQPQNASDSYKVEIPKILQAYLNIGAKICSLPAIDRQFKTIDFLTISNIADFGRWRYPNPLKQPLSLRIHND
ncbi:MAG: GNAT family N-acetyltransferase [Nostoc sp. NMS1]|uniref:GNAT family N-acetyltransferase n=1 Tax=unclassified Nostoc TaxID=2593658 RepID=UPI0025ED47A3|nr:MULTISPECIES: GNAT family N-acyltransferase [unclassified Nostoc]MBN3907697.1 GNAT family N-acetyltransferase [Nostoc sp. NMS1]MBN3992727.1 GNAT family N-acetyltransferase [Nostoc sp. NMS2]